MGLDMEIKGVTRTSVEYLKDQIISGKLKGGEKLNEDQLSSDLGISRPPLREAFRILEQEHLIVSIPRRGSYVKKASIEDFQQIYQVRMMIECSVIDMLKVRNIRDLPQVVSALAQASDLRIPFNDNPKEKLTYLRVMDEFHIKLVESACNELLSHFYEIIRSNISRYKYMFIFIPGAAKQYIHEHQQILDFINIGAYEQAKEHMKVHINNSREAIENKILKRGLEANQEDLKVGAVGR